MVKHLNPNSIALLGTGTTDEKVIERAYAAGFYKVIIKPFRPEQIKELVDLVKWKINWKKPATQF